MAWTCNCSHRKAHLCEECERCACCCDCLYLPVATTADQAERNDRLTNLYRQHGRIVTEQARMRCWREGRGMTPC